jgi:hypothetical protein
VRNKADKDLPDGVGEYMIQGRILFSSQAILVLVFSLVAQASLDSVHEEDVLPGSVSLSNTPMINSTENSPIHR